MEKEFDICKSDIVLLNVSNDHIHLDNYVYDFIERVRKIEDIELITDGFDSAYDNIIKYKDGMQIVKGELIDTLQSKKSGDLRLVTDSISSYYPLKKENDICQALLENEIAPMIAFSNMLGKPVRKEYLIAAYKELLKTHPHDNICGCSSD